MFNKVAYIYGPHRLEVTLQFPQTELNAKQIAWDFLWNSNWNSTYAQKLAFDIVNGNISFLQELS